MKLFGAIAVNVKGEEILKKPGVLGKIRIWFGGAPKTTGKVKASIEATAIVDGVRDALKSIGVSNAVALTVDDIVLFHDKDGRPDDLGDLFLAFHEHSSVLGAGFNTLRLTVEHVEAGLHIVVEVQARSIHPISEPAVRVVASGRIRDLEARPGEDADAYRARIEPFMKDATALEVARVQFEAFVARMSDAIGKAMPEVRAEVVTAQARIQRPVGDDTKQPDPRAQDPMARNYDPYMAYYPSPFDTLLSVMLWSSVFSLMGGGMFHHHPDIVVVNQDGTPTGHVTDPGIEQADPAHSDYAESPGGAEAGAEAGGADGDGGGDFGGDGGGDAGGDFGGDVGGGGDFGGGDFGDFGGFD
jgi:hypothetical protein